MNALTHAREPESMQTLLYFADDLLSRYATDPFATYLLNQRTLYTRPARQPRQVRLQPAGLRRQRLVRLLAEEHPRQRQRRPFRRPGRRRRTSTATTATSGDSTTGVRVPSPSTTPIAAPRRSRSPRPGRSATIVNQIKPTIAISIHTFGDQFVHPWGYQIVATPDSTLFKEWDDELTRGQLVHGGPGRPHALRHQRRLQRLVLRRRQPAAQDVRLDARDRQRRTTASSRRRARILPLALENLRSCYVATAIAGPWVQQDGIAIDEGALSAGYGAGITVRARNAGAVATPGPIAGTLVPLDPGVRIVLRTVAYPALASRQSANPLGSFHVAIDDTVTPGRLVRFEVDFTAASGFFSRDTIAIPLGTPTVVAFDDASSGLGKWFSTGWGIVTNDPTHPSRYFADSPSGNCGDARRYRPSAQRDDQPVAWRSRLRRVRGPLADRGRLGRRDARDQPERHRLVPAVRHRHVAGRRHRRTGQHPDPGNAVLRRRRAINGSPIASTCRSSPARPPRRCGSGSVCSPTARWTTRASTSIRCASSSTTPRRSLALVAVGGGRPPLAFAFERAGSNPRATESASGSPCRARAQVRLEIMDLQGRTVRTLAQTSLAPGGTSAPGTSVTITAAA